MLLFLEHVTIFRNIISLKGNQMSFTMSSVIGQFSRSLTFKKSVTSSILLMPTGDL